MGLGLGPTLLVRLNNDHINKYVLYVGHFFGARISFESLRNVPSLGPEARFRSEATDPHQGTSGQHGP